MKERNAIAALEAAKAAKAAQYTREAEKAAAAAADKTTMTAVSEMETTFVGNTTTNVSAQSTKVVKKKVAKPKLTAREKKERSVRCIVALKNDILLGVLTIACRWKSRK